MKLQTQDQIDIKCKIFNYCMENMGKKYMPRTKSEKTDLLKFIGECESKEDFKIKTCLDYNVVYEKAILKYDFSTFIKD